MKAYGIPRLRWLQWPDIADIQCYALKSSTGRVKSKSGEYKSYARNTKSRRTTRRYWKKRIRRIHRDNLRKCNDYPVREYTGSPVEAVGT